MENVVEPGGLLDVRLRALTEWLPRLVFTALPDGRVEYLNRRWLADTGINETAALGDGWLDVLHPDDCVLEHLVRPPPHRERLAAQLDDDEVLDERWIRRRLGRIAGLLPRVQLLHLA